MYGCKQNIKESDCKNVYYLTLIINIYLYKKRNYILLKFKFCEIHIYVVFVLFNYKNKIPKPS